LSKDEVEKLKKEAEMYAAEDQKKRELIEAKNQAESMIYLAEKSLRDAGEKVPADIKTTVEQKISRVKEVKDGVDTAVIQGATQELSQELQKVGQFMYNNNNQPQGGEQTPPGGNEEHHDTGPNSDSTSN
jgi:molecular chaperone DnaK